MSMYGAAGSMAAAGTMNAAAAVAQAIRASGSVVRVEPDAFLAIIERQESPLIVSATSGWLSKRYEYLCAYKGLTFFTKAGTPLELPDSAELVASRKIWIPA